MSSHPVTESVPLSRAERRQQERTQRKLQTSLLVSVSRLELSKVLAPISSTVEMHHALLGFITERGLAVRDGRAYLDQEELQAYLRERNAEREAPAVADEPPTHDEHDLMRFDTESPAHV